MYAHQDSHIEGYLDAVQVFSAIADALSNDEVEQRLSGDPPAHSGFRRLT